MADQDKINTEGRDKNAALPLNASDNKAGAERYPSTGQDDAVEAGEAVRTFHPDENPQPRQGAGDASKPPGPHDRTGPAGDPAEGKR